MGIKWLLDSNLNFGNLATTKLGRSPFEKGYVVCSLLVAGLEEPAGGCS